MTLGTTIWAFGGNISKTAVHADIPDENKSEISAFSSSAIISSAI